MQCAVTLSLHSSLIHLQVLQPFFPVGPLSLPLHLFLSTTDSATACAFTIAVITVHTNHTTSPPHLTVCIEHLHFVLFFTCSLFVSLNHKRSCRQHLCGPCWFFCHQAVHLSFEWRVWLISRYSNYQQGGSCPVCCLFPVCLIFPGLL